MGLAQGMRMTTYGADQLLLLDWERDTRALAEHLERLAWALAHGRPRSPGGAQVLGELPWVRVASAIPQDPGGAPPREHGGFSTLPCDGVLVTARVTTRAFWQRMLDMEEEGPWLLV